MTAEYRNHTGSVYYNGKVPIDGLERTEMGKTGFRGIVQLILADLTHQQEDTDDAAVGELDVEGAKGVIEMFWGREIARTRIWVGRRGFERCIWLEDYGLGLETDPEFEEESDPEFEEES